MKNNSLAMWQQTDEDAISRPAADAMNLISSIPESSRRGEGSRLRILSPRKQSFSATKKYFWPLITGLAIFSATWVGAQSTPLPENTSVPAASTAAAAPSPSPTAPVEPPSLIPPNILPGPGAAALPQIPTGPDLPTLNALFKQSSLGKAADEHRLHLQMSALETRIRNDEDLHELKSSANKARTDLERRHRFKAYYQLYFKKLRALASSTDLQDYLRAQEATHEASLLQPRVRHETDEAEAKALAQLAGGANNAAALPTPVQARASDALRNP